MVIKQATEELQLKLLFTLIMCLLCCPSKQYSFIIQYNFKSHAGYTPGNGSLVIVRPYLIPD